MTTTAFDYSSPEWQDIAVRAKLRDGRRCFVARLLGGPCKGRLHAHHIVPVAEGGAGYDLENVGTACAGHHPQWEALRRAIVRYRDRNADGDGDLTRERRIRNARRFIRNVGALIDTEDQLIGSLYGWGGYGLREYADDTELRERMIAYWREIREKAGALDTDLLDVAHQTHGRPRRRRSFVRA